MPSPAISYHSGQTKEYNQKKKRKIKGALSGSSEKKRESISQTPKEAY